MFLQDLAVGELMVNCYILGDEVTQEALIIDPGEEAARILEAVSSAGLMVKQIVATHGHFDHIGGVAGLKSEIKAPFMIHEADLPFVRDCRTSGANWGFEVDQCPDPESYLVEGDLLEVGGLSLKIIHTPGHSPGGVSLYLASPEGTDEAGLVFTGDTLSYRSVGRTDFRLGDFGALAASIREKLYRLPDETRVLSGHGTETTIGQEKRSNLVVPERNLGARLGFGLS